MLSASAQQKMSRLDEEADARGAIVVYPEGTGGAYAGWNAGPSPLGHLYKDVDDVAFIAALLDRLAKSLCVDPKRVLCTGFSLGGSMCYRIACELSERVAAIAPVAGPDVAPACSPKRALPLLAFWGTADGFAAYAGDPGTQPNNKGAVKTVGDYAKRAGCEAASKPTTSKGAVSCETWGGCKDGAEATLCTVKGGGHTWPGGEPWALFGGLVTGGAINKDVSASLLILDFFYKHAP
jgi:polyhydroxybutyrate depolymerase